MVLFLHTAGPGTARVITFHRVEGVPMDGPVSTPHRFLVPTAIALIGAGVLVLVVAWLQPDVRDRRGRRRLVRPRRPA